MSEFFGDDELERLRQHGIVLFARRVIFDAQPPMTQARIAEVQAACGGPIPAELLDLWRVTAGGRLDYDLRLNMNGSEEAIDWRWLFWHGGEDGNDLQLRIDHEMEGARQADAEASSVGGPRWDGKLTLLPIGGNAEADRIYAVVEPGADHGHVLAWKQGLPTAWPHEMHEDGITTIASDLCAAFESLHLDEDPLAPAGDYFTGRELLEFLDLRHEEHGLDLELSDKLIDFYRRAIIDWRTPLAEGTLAQEGPLARAALRHAIATDDAALVERLAAAGVALDGPLDANTLATDLALSHGAHAAAEALVRAGAPVPHDALDCIDSAVSPELAELLLARGATPTVQAIVECVACGAPAAARLIAAAYGKTHEDLPQAFAASRDAMLAELEASIEEVRAGRLSHYLGAVGLTKRADHLLSFSL